MRSGLSAIPIRVEQQDATASTGTIGGGVTALLVEIASKLDRLADGDEPCAIDLRSMPMSPADREQLLKALGQGEAGCQEGCEGRGGGRASGLGAI